MLPGVKNSSARPPLPLRERAGLEGRASCEDAASLAMSLVAVFLPVLVVVALLLVGWAAYAMLRRFRRRRRPAAT